jgi:plasmid stabilization system protein ParE
LNVGYVLNAKGLLTESAEENIIAAIVHLASQNPRAAARLVSVISNPPRIGSAKLTWRDGQLNGIEIVEQTY